MIEVFLCVFQNQGTDYLRGAGSIPYPEQLVITMLWILDFFPSNFEMSVYTQ